MKLYRKKFVTFESFISNEKNIKHLYFYYINLLHHLKTKDEYFF